MDNLFEEINRKGSSGDEENAAGTKEEIMDPTPPPKRVRKAVDHFTGVVLFLLIPAAVILFLYYFIANNKLPTEGGTTANLSAHMGEKSGLPAAPEPDTPAAQVIEARGISATGAGIPQAQTRQPTGSIKKQTVSTRQAGTQEKAPAPKQVLSDMARLSIPGKYPLASVRLLTPADLRGKTREDLLIMRNEIFARHFYRFQGEKMAAYFSSQNWYTPLHDDVSPKLTDLEKKNIELIRRFERK